MIRVAQNIGFETALFLIKALGIHARLNQASLSRENKQGAIVALASGYPATIGQHRLQLLFAGRRDQLVIDGEAEIQLIIDAVYVYVVIIILVALGRSSASMPPKAMAGDKNRMQAVTSLR